jgi:hypothetical protein
MNSVNKNKAFFTHCLFERAKRARGLYHTLGTLSCKCIYPITTEGIKLAEQIFGLDIELLKGKTTQKTPEPVTNDYIELMFKDMTNSIQKMTTQQECIIAFIFDIWTVTKEDTNYSIFQQVALLSNKSLFLLTQKTSYLVLRSTGKQTRASTI